MKSGKCANMTVLPKPFKSNLLVPVGQCKSLTPTTNRPSGISQEIESAAF